MSPAPAGPGRNAFHSPRSRASARSDCEDGYPAPGPRVVELGHLPREHRLGGVHPGLHEVEERLPQLLRARVPAEVHQSRLPVSSCAQRLEPHRDQGLHHRADPREPVAQGLSVHVPVVDPLEDHRELEAGQRLVEAEVTEVAAGARRIPLHEVLATREAGRPRGGGDAGSDTERGDALVGEQERDVGQRVAEGRHLPVDDRADRVVGRDEDVVEPVVAVDHGARRRRRGCGRPAGSAARRSPRPRGCATRPAAGPNGSPGGRGSPRAGRSPPSPLRRRRRGAGRPGCRRGARRSRGFASLPTSPARPSVRYGTPSTSDIT